MAEVASSTGVMPNAVWCHTETYEEKQGGGKDIARGELKGIGAESQSTTNATESKRTTTDCYSKEYFDMLKAQKDQGSDSRTPPVGSQETLPKF